MKKITVGQEVWVKPSSTYSHTKEPYLAVVTKVGRKYLELDGNHRYKYDLETLKECGDGFNRDRVYFSLQEILDEEEQYKLLGKIRKEIQSEHGYSLSQLRAIADIIGIKKIEKWQ